jgi:hypothetical protein
MKILERHILAVVDNDVINEGFMCLIVIKILHEKPSLFHKLYPYSLT